MRAHSTFSMNRPGCYQPRRQLLRGIRTYQREAPYHGARKFGLPCVRLDPRRNEGRGRYDRHNKADKPKEDIWLCPLRKDSGSGRSTADTRPVLSADLRPDGGLPSPGHGRRSRRRHRGGKRGRHDCAFSAGARSGQRFTAAPRVSAAVRKENQADYENCSSRLDRTLQVPTSRRL